MKEMKPREYCAKVNQRAEACMTELETDADYQKNWRKDFKKHWEFLRTAAMKSNLLGRMLYGEQDLRTEQCPTHKGKWSGLDDGKCDCNNTGWLPNASNKP